MDTKEIIKHKKLKTLLKKLKIINTINAIILYFMFIASIFLVTEYHEPIRFIIKNKLLKNSINFIIGIIVLWSFFIRIKINETVIKLKNSFLDPKDINIMYLIYNIALFVNYEYFIYFNHHILKILLFCIITVFIFILFYLEQLEKKYCSNNNIFCIEKFYREIQDLQK